MTTATLYCGWFTWCRVRGETKQKNRMLNKITQKPFCATSWDIKSFHVIGKSIDILTLTCHNCFNFFFSLIKMRKKNSIKSTRYCSPASTTPSHAIQLRHRWINIAGTPMKFSSQADIGFAKVHNVNILLWDDSRISCFCCSSLLVFFSILSSQTTIALSFHRLQHVKWCSMA